MLIDTGLSFVQLFRKQWHDHSRALIRTFIWFHISQRFSKNTFYKTKNTYV